MSHFDSLPEFKKEFSMLAKKYRSLPEDFEKFERLIEASPVGIGKNFTIVHGSEKLKIVKARLACRSLRDRSIRIIYAYHKNLVNFVYIEIYFKGDKSGEDGERIRLYLKNCS